MISISTLTKSFFLIFNRLVTFKVCGITTIEKLSEKIFEIVNETPFIATELLEFKNFFRVLFIENINSRIFHI